MAKFNRLIIKGLGGEEIHFVTRGKSKPPTMDEVEDYCRINDIWLAGDVNFAQKDWTPLCNNNVFLADLKQGLVHCSSKYGVSQKTIQAYIDKKMPHTNSNIYKGRGNHG